jgi:hypothetical protein
MFGKFFACTFTGSMVGAGSPVFAVWGYVIANARNGSVELNPRLLSMVLGDTGESIESAIEYLCSPDERSRTKDHDGRRLLPMGSFMYEVPNHDAYRKIANEVERREYFKEKKREERARGKALTCGHVLTVNKSPRCDSASDSGEGLKEGGSKGEGCKGGIVIPDELSVLDGFEAAWDEFVAHRKRRKAATTPRAAKPILARLAERPRDAVELIGYMIERNWLTFEEHWLEGTKFQIKPTKTHLTGRAAEHARQAEIHTKTSEFGI